MKIEYAIDRETGLTYSRLGDNIAVPVKGRKNRFGTHDFKLLKFHISGLGADELASLQWTERLPESLKQYHRVFWRVENEADLKVSVN